MLVANQRTQQLQKEEWTDKVWLGDNVAVTAKLTHDAVVRDERINSKKGRSFTRSVGYGIANKFTQLAQLLMQEKRANTLSGSIKDCEVRAVR